MKQTHSALFSSFRPTPLVAGPDWGDSLAPNLLQEGMPFFGGSCKSLMALAFPLLSLPIENVALRAMFAQTLQLAHFCLESKNPSKSSPPRLSGPFFVPPSAPSDDRKRRACRPLRSWHRPNQPEIRARGHRAQGNPWRPLRPPRELRSSFLRPKKTEDEEEEEKREVPRQEGEWWLNGDKG